ncbi:MAG: peptide deformylase [bacterium]
MLKIITKPNPVLRQECRKLEADEIKTQEIQELIKQMIPCMRSQDGAGLAAPQVGRPLQICIISKEFIKNQATDLVLINPKWKRRSIFKVLDEEGCLSVPKIFGKVKRYKKIKLEALDENGQEIQLTAQGFFARIIQHEVDHLHGILFIDKSNEFRRVE